MADLAVSAAPSTSALKSKRAVAEARLNMDAEVLRVSFNKTPFAFSHNLHELEIFQPDYLRGLADRYTKAGRDFYVAGSADVPGVKFFAVPRVQFKNPNEAMENLDKQACRILLKRPENHDPHFRELIDLLFRQVMELHGGLGNEKIIRLESSVFISSAAATTPLHFDPEVGFFSQIEGEKFYHAYAPADVSEPELERFYKRGVVDIAQVPLNKRDPQLEHVFDLLPGKSFHQPQNSPHWVRTGNERSISYTFVFETEAGRALGRTRAFNHYVRKMRMSPALPGLNPAKDARKAGFMQTVLPVRIKIDRVYARVIEPTRKLGSIMVRKSGIYPFYKKHFAPSASGDE